MAEMPSKMGSLRLRLLNAIRLNYPFITSWEKIIIDQAYCATAL